jgi:hypothetical protein
VLRPKLFPLTALAIVLTACGRTATPTPEQEVRDVIAQGEHAAEQRDFSALMKLVSPQYSDDAGRDAETLEQYVRGYLMIHPSIRLLTRIDSIDFPYKDMARVNVTVGSLARESNESNSFDLAADLQQLEIELVREGEQWRVRRASRVE